MFKMLQITLVLLGMTCFSFGQTAGGGANVFDNRTDVFTAAEQKFEGFNDEYFYSTTTYTFTDLVVFSYFDNSSFYVYDQAGTKIDSVTLNDNEYHVFATGTGVFIVECTESFTVLVGDPVSRNVLGFFAVDESGSPLSTRLNTYMPAHYTTG